MYTLKVNNSDADYGTTTINEIAYLADYIRTKYNISYSTNITREVEKEFNCKIINETDENGVSFRLELVFQSERYLNWFLLQLKY